jgi:hypothetical protein
MAKINLSVSEFENIVITFLLYKMLNTDFIETTNEDFNDMVEIMEKKGLQPLFLRYYLNMDPQLRVEFKRIKNVFEGKKGVRADIFVYPEEE